MVGRTGAPPGGGGKDGCGNRGQWPPCWRCRQRSSSRPISPDPACPPACRPRAARRILPERPAVAGHAPVAGHGPQAAGQHDRKARHSDRDDISHDPREQQPDTDHEPERRPAWIGRRQRRLSDRMHAGGDEHARLQGWEVKKSTGRFGFGARIYRDPRFDDRRRQTSPAGSFQGQPWVRPGDIPEDHLAGAAGGSGDE